MNSRPGGAEQVEAVVLASGGLDSCVAAALTAADCGPRRTALLHVSYGQRTASREERSFSEIASRLGAAAARVIRLGGLGALGGSSLTDPERPVPDAAEDAMGTIPSTYVPFRNTILSALGVAWAEVLGAHRVVLGAVQTDRAGYPDCREEFFRALNALVREGTRPETRIRVEAPLVRMNKAEIIRLGARIGAPLELTWSCYRETETACGSCESCRLRLEGFEQAGLSDPIPYEGLR